MRPDRHPRVSRWTRIGVGVFMALVMSGCERSEEDTARQVDPPAVRAADPAAEASSERRVSTVDEPSPRRQEIRSVDAEAIPTSPAPAAPPRSSEPDTGNGPSVALIDIAVRGPADRATARRWVRQRLDGLESCYVDRLKSLEEPDAPVSGTLTVSWRSVRTNRVEDVRITDDQIGDSALASCVRRTVEGWQIPSNCKGGLEEIDATFRFEAGATDSTSDGESANGESSRGEDSDDPNNDPNNAPNNDPNTDGPRVEAKRATIKGAMSRSIVNARIDKHRAELLACYTTGLETDPTLAGEVVIKFVIKPDGSVPSAKLVSDGMGAPSVADCMLTSIRTWRFPQWTGGLILVKQPFVFARGGADGD